MLSIFKWLFPQVDLDATMLLAKFVQVLRSAISFRLQFNKKLSIAPAKKQKQTIFFFRIWKIVFMILSLVFVVCFQKFWYK